MNNTVILIGRLTHDPELRYTNSNKAVVNSTMAVNRISNDETDFINFQIWNKSAENISKYCHKGSLIAIRGELRTEKYEDKNGNKRINVFVLANSVTFLDSKKEEKKEENDVYSDYGEEVNIDDFENILD